MFEQQAEIYRKMRQWVDAAPYATATPVKVTEQFVYAYDRPVHEHKWKIDKREIVKTPFPVKQEYRHCEDCGKEIVVHW